MCDSVQEPATVSKKRPASPERRPGGDEDPDLECGICTELLNDARQAPCCAALACCVCLDTAARKSGTCPFCRTALRAGSGLRDLRMERRAANTVRACPHAGCEFSGKRDALRAHVDECSKRPSDEVVASLRARIAKLEATLEAKESDHAARLARHASELAAARQVSDKYEKSAIQYAFSENMAIGNSTSSAPGSFILGRQKTEGCYTPCLRAINDRFAFRFEWSRASEFVWTGEFQHGDIGVELKVRKGNNTITLELERTSADGAAYLQRVEVVSPRGFGRSHVEHIRVPALRTYYHHVRLVHSYELFEKRFVQNDAFVISV